jgi:peptide/nickel transport system substrate-binding protein
MKMRGRIVKFLLPVLVLFIGCGDGKELSREELAAFQAEGAAEILAKTVSKPWRGEAFIPGAVSGTWREVMNQDPKSFNLLIAEQDSVTMGVTHQMLSYLVRYDSLKREWLPHAASFEVVVDEAHDKLDVIYTLRDDLYWTWYGQDRKVKVTSDDIVFWYDEIWADPEFNSSSYFGQFLVLEDGTEARITIEKIDDLKFVFHFPRIVAEPVFSTNMNIQPRMDYEEAKLRGGAEAVLKLFSINTDPKGIPSVGEWYLTEYISGQRLVYKRNPHYWEKDSGEVSLPYIEEQVVRIIPDENTKFLLFKQNDIESYAARPEDLDDLINRRNPRYTVYNSEGSLSASFWTFNQNPVNRGTKQYDWFTQKEFRQAMSCLLNRDRIISQVYRGLAEPKYYFFPEPNRYFDPDIKLEYVYNPEQAVALLSSIGISRDDQGIMRDSEARAVEFNLTIRSESTVVNDIASIISDELGKIGIKVVIRVLDFQKIVEQLMKTYDWESMLMGLTGSEVFPTQGSNVWVSSANLHLWHPNQESPATEWEARIDFLYNEGAYTVDPLRAKPIWDEYQRIILEQCPLLYLVRPRSFVAILDRWDQSNFYFDNLNGMESGRIFLEP